MAERTLICKICGDSFQHNTKGRPAPACPTHREQYRRDYQIAYALKKQKAWAERRAKRQQKEVEESSENNPSTTSDTQPPV